MNQIIKLIFLNLLNVFISVYFTNFYSNILFFGTVLLPLNFGILLLLPIIYYILKLKLKINYKYYLTLTCNIISIVILYYLFTKYDVPTETKIWHELILQGFFIANGYYFAANFIQSLFRNRIS